MEGAVVLVALAWRAGVQGSTLAAQREVHALLYAGQLLPGKSMVVRPHPRKTALTPLQSAILAEIADPVEVDPAYVCVLAKATALHSAPAAVIAAAEDAVRALARHGLIGFCRWSPDRGESHELATAEEFCSAIRNKVRWVRATDRWESDAGSRELLLTLMPEGETLLGA